MSVWNRLNIWYDKITDVYKLGPLQKAMIEIIYRHRQMEKIAGHYSLVSASMGSQKVNDFLIEYVNLVFPEIKEKREYGLYKQIKYLEEVCKKPFHVRKIGGDFDKKQQQAFLQNFENKIKRQ